MSSAPGSPGGRGTNTLPPPARRGATLIPDTVVALITVRAAREALTRHAGASTARLGLGTPRATASVHEGSARLDVSLDLPYPVDIAQAGGEIRHYITERVSHLTGLRVDDITVSVHRLVPGESLRRRRVH
ncbi:Asp23/Gls24 family envelope stress response protein [Streptomyces sp. NBC_01613]|uniref:Asp23/Gls24 family envelope stress response protein n=1 Tax=Streptomyces sp. NBC_01613 TaxID=2975896 RepID=UPI00386F9203